MAVGADIKVLRCSNSGSWSRSSSGKPGWSSLSYSSSLVRPEKSVIWALSSSSWAPNSFGLLSWLNWYQRSSNHSLILSSSCSAFTGGSRSRWVGLSSELLENLRYFEFPNRFFPEARKNLRYLEFSNPWARGVLENRRYFLEFPAWPLPDFLEKRKYLELPRRPLPELRENRRYFLLSWDGFCSPPQTLPLNFISKLFF